MENASDCQDNWRNVVSKDGAGGLCQIVLCSVTHAIEKCPVWWLVAWKPISWESDLTSGGVFGNRFFFWGGGEFHVYFNCSCQINCSSFHCAHLTPFLWETLGETQAKTDPMTGYLQLWVCSDKIINTIGNSHDVGLEEGRSTLKRIIKGIRVVDLEWLFVSGHSVKTRACLTDELVKPKWSERMFSPNGRD